LVDGTAKPAVAAALRARLADLTRTGVTALPAGLAGAALARWYPDYVLVLDDEAAIAAASPAGEAGQAPKTARYSWNEPLVVRTAEVRVVAAEGRARAGAALLELAHGTPGRRLVVSDSPRVRERAAADGAAVADLNWLLGPLPQD
jgi:hypothetical protein